MRRMSVRQIAYHRTPSINEQQMLQIAAFLNAVSVAAIKIEFHKDLKKK
jgi:hypothetical protein